MIKDDEEAEDDFTQALKLVPGDKAVELELAKLQKRKDDRKKRERAAFSKMFD